jgi:hypothetical protein
MQQNPLKTVEFVAMTDSYAKWAAGLLELAPRSWKTNFYVMDHQQSPTARQLDAALAHTPHARSVMQHISSRSLMNKWKHNPPTAVVVAGPGPFILALRQRLDKTSWGRAIALIGGSPGIATHLDENSLRFRLALDVLIVASHNERTTLSREMTQLFGSHPVVALSTLPFIQNIEVRKQTDDSQDLVFAAQPDIPATKEERLNVLRALLQFKRQHKLETIYIKLRALVGEAQTHTELFSYQDLFNELVTRDEATRDEIRFLFGSMQDALANPNSILATISSTAAIESIALGNPTLIVADAGVSRARANEVFMNSGLVNRLEDVALPYRGLPNDDWKRLNYFHNSAENDWISSIDAIQSRTSPELSQHFSSQQLLKNATSEALRLSQQSAPLFKLYRLLFKR